MPSVVYRYRRPPGTRQRRRASGWYRLRALVLPLLTGVALGLSFPPYPLSVLAWGALVPLLLRWTERTSAGWMLAEAYLSFGVACAVAFYWVLLHEMPEAALASLGGLLLFPLFMALPFAASLPLRRRWGTAVGFGALAAFYLVMEWGLSRGPLAFPWPLLGHTQATLDPFRQLAALAGVPGLTAWLLGLNGLLLAVVRPIHGLWRGLAALAVLLLIAGAYTYGTRQLEAPTLDAPDTRALLVQPALPPSDWSDVTSTARVDTLLHLSTSALDTTDAPVDLVIWPETALPAFPDPALQQDLYASLQRWTAQHDITLLTGAVEPVPATDDERGVYFNSAFFIRPDTLQRYRKQYLVPFAEHVPFSESLPRLQALRVSAGGVAGYRRGTRQPLLHNNSGFRIGALICFESTFSHYVRAYVAPQGNAPPADFLVTLAQDGWWDRSPGYRQHLAFSQLRAIETRRAMAFVTVTGTTTLIDPRGQTTASTRWMERDARYVAIPHPTRQSPYAEHGDWLSPMALALSVGFVLIGLMNPYVRRRRRQRIEVYYTR